MIRAKTETVEFVGKYELQRIDKTFALHVANLFLFCNLDKALAMNSVFMRRRVEIFLLSVRIV